MGNFKGEWSVVISIKILTVPYGVENAVDVEGGVDLQRGVEDLVPHSASTRCSGRSSRQRQESFWRVRDVLGKVRAVPASVGDGVQLGHKCLTGNVI